MPDTAGIRWGKTASLRDIPTSILGFPCHNTTFEDRHSVRHDCLRRQCFLERIRIPPSRPGTPPLGLTAVENDQIDVRQDIDQRSGTSCYRLSRDVDGSRDECLHPQKMDNISLGLQPSSNETVLLTHLTVRPSDIDDDIVLSGDSAFRTSLQLSWRQLRKR